MMECFERTDGAPVNTQNDISLAVLNVICAMVFSSRYDLEDSEFYDIIELNSKISNSQHRTIAAVVSLAKVLAHEADE